MVMAMAMVMATVMVMVMVATMVMAPAHLEPLGPSLHDEVAADTSERPEWRTGLGNSIKKPGTLAARATPLLLRRQYSLVSLGVFFLSIYPHVSL